MSTSNTRTILRKNDAVKVVRRERLYDHLYNPVYTVSSEVDHARANLKAYASRDRVKKVPEFGSMFSNLPHYPPYALILDPVDPVPAFVDRRWHGHTEQHREALKQLSVICAEGQSQKEEM